ncbi:MAG: Abi family protein [Coriobacteriia bacterium]|nr:Abi family protein [Coriobacteriia bacterium]
MNKPFQAISEQIAILNRRGLSTDDKTPNILLREGYYCVINGYKDPFLFPGKQNDEDSFRRGASFNEVYRLFLFDRSLRMLLFKYVAIAEAALKTITALNFHKHTKRIITNILKPARIAMMVDILYWLVI